MRRIFPSILNLRWDVLAWNTAGDMLFNFSGKPPEQRNLLWMLSTDEHMRALLCPWRTSIKRVDDGAHQLEAKSGPLLCFASDWSCAHKALRYGSQKPWNPVIARLPACAITQVPTHMGLLLSVLAQRLQVPSRSTGNNPGRLPSRSTTIDRPDRPWATAEDQAKSPG